MRIAANKTVVATSSIELGAKIIATRPTAAALGERPTIDPSSPTLRQQPTSFTDELIDVDVVESNKQKD